MEQYIPKSALEAEIKRLDALYHTSKDLIGDLFIQGLFCFIDTIEVKDVNEVPATVTVNKYGNRFISSWPGLKEYDDLKEGEEIKIVIKKK